METAKENAQEVTAQIANQLTPAEATRFRSSLEISLTEGSSLSIATSRAFRKLWSSRLGYASGMSDKQWTELREIADRLNVIA